MLDTALDRTVIGGYTSVGYRIRSRTWHDSDLRSLEGKVVVVTGATSGLGLAAAEGFARLGATVWLVARDEARGEQVRAELARQTGNRDLHLGICDLSDLSSVRSFVERFAAQSQRLDVLVNNAGVLTHHRQLSVDGIELTFATNVLGPFLLTNLLLPLLERSAPARVINVSSGGMYTQRLLVDDLQSEQGEFDGPAAYARSKRAEVILTELWAQRLEDRGVAVHAMHPGWADTPGIRAGLPRFHRLTRPLLRSAEQGADTIVWLGAATEPGRRSGQFWHDRRPRPTNLLLGKSTTAADRERLWQQCCELSGWQEDPQPKPPKEEGDGPISSDD